MHAGVSGRQALGQRVCAHDSRMQNATSAQPQVINLYHRPWQHLAGHAQDFLFRAWHNSQRMGDGHADQQTTTESAEFGGMAVQPANLSAQAMDELLGSTTQLAPQKQCMLPKSLWCAGDSFTA